MSFRRPVIYSSPSRRKPRSPVRSQVAPACSTKVLAEASGLRQEPIVKAQGWNPPATLAAGDKQGGFRQTVGRKPGIGAETARLELLGKTLQGVEANRLGT